MDTFEISDTLDEFLNDNYHPDKVRSIRQCFSYFDNISNLTIYQNIDLNELNSSIDEILYNIDTIGKDDAITTIDMMLLNAFLLWLEEIGILIDRDQHYEYGGGYTMIVYILTGLSTLLDPEIDIAYDIREISGEDYEDEIMMLSELLSEQVADIHPLNFYEIIGEVNEHLIDHIVENANLVIFKNNPSINNNLQVVIDQIVKISPKFINTIITHDIFVNDRDLERVEDNVKLVLDAVERNHKDKVDYSIESIQYEIAAALILSEEFSRNQRDVLDYLNDLNLDSLEDIYQEEGIRIIKDRTKTLLEQIIQGNKL